LSITEAQRAGLATAEPVWARGAEPGTGAAACGIHGRWRSPTAGIVNGKAEGATASTVEDEVESVVADAVEGEAGRDGRHGGGRLRRWRMMEDGGGLR
jgi:hypothetical protein